MSQLAIRCLTLAGVLLAVSVAQAQVSTATIYGTVTDPSGAAVAQAGVTASNEQTGLTWKTNANTGGEFTFTFLPVGQYSIVIRAAGFKEERHTGLELAGGQEVRLTYPLTLGAVTESVTVSAEAQLINTVNAEQGHSVNSLRVAELPAQNRNWTNLIGLGAGLSVQGGAVAINGLPPDGFRFTVDGTDAGSSGESESITSTSVSMESIRELTVTSGIAPPETGPTMSGNVNVITKSGTNELHGSLFENNRTENVSARGQFLTTNPPLVFNQFGGSVGGPAIKNKLFFFGVYEGLRQRAFTSVNGNVPTQEFRQTVIAAVPATKAFFDTLPLPNSAYAPGATTGFFQSAASTPNTDNHVSVRGDYQITSGNMLTVRFTHDVPSSITPRISAANQRTTDTQTRQGVASFIHSAPNWSAETRIGYNRNHRLRLDHIYDLGISAITGSLGFSNSGETMENFGSNWSGEEVVAWNHGRHAVKFGGLYQIYKSGRNNITVPEFQFSNVADLLANIPSQVTISFGVNKYDLYNWINGYFLQDDIRISRSFMLNAGFRYDHFSVPKESAGRLFNRTGPFGFGPYINPNAIYQANLLDISPRLGFAWTVTSKTVVRGGFGKLTSSHNQFGGPVELIQNAIDEPNRVIFSKADAQNFNIRYPTTNATILPLVKGAGQIATTVIAQHFPQPYSLQWTFGVARELPGALSFETSYNGNHAVHANTVLEMNQVNPVTGLRPYPAYAEFHYYDGSESVHYNAWQNTIRRRFANNFQMSAVYVYSNSLSYSNGANLSYPNPPQDTNSIRGERGLSPFDARHHFHTDFLYEFPLLKLSASKGRGATLLLGGWQVTGIFTAQTGLPLSITQSTTYVSTRPDYVSGAVYMADANQTLQFLNKAAFARVPIGAASGAPLRFGNSGRNSLRLPGYWNPDLSLSKNLQFSERYRFQLRCDMFDAFNHTNFSTVSTEITSANFGRFTATKGARLVQFNARLTF